MKTIQQTLALLVCALVPACGQHLVEFPTDAGVTLNDLTLSSLPDLTGMPDASMPDFAVALGDLTMTPIPDLTMTPIPDLSMFPPTDFTGVTLDLITPPADLTAPLPDLLVRTDAGLPIDLMMSVDLPLMDLATNDLSNRDLSTSPPTVLSTSPSNLAVNVSVNKKITATFSRSMDPLTINGTTFLLKQGNNTIAGVVTYDGPSNTATFTPSMPLGLSLLYTATITTGAKDPSGSALAANYVWTFTTGACSQAPITLRTAANFVVLAGSTVTNTGMSHVTGDLGVSPGTAVTGFPPGILVGAQHAGDPTSAQGIADLTTAYNEAAGRTLCPITVSGNLGGQTLAPGLYKSTSSLAVSSGDLTLDAQGDSDAVFIFQMASTLTTTAGRQVVLAGGAKSTNVFWQVGTSATLGTTSSFQGTVMADQAITMNTGATLNGRVLARIAAVALDTNTIVKPAP